MYGWGGAEHMAGMWLWWIIGIGVLVAIIWLLARTSSSTGGGAAQSAEEILKRRYAKGEIDEDEYSRRLEDLRK